MTPERIAELRADAQEWMSLGYHGFAKPILECLDEIERLTDERVRILSALGEHPDSPVVIEDEIGRLRHDQRLLVEKVRTRIGLVPIRERHKLADEIEKGF